MAFEQDVTQGIREILAAQIDENYEKTSFASPSALEDSIVVKNDGIFINDYAIFLNDGTRFIEGEVFIDTTPTDAQSELEELVSGEIDIFITKTLEE